MYIVYPWSQQQYKQLLCARGRPLSLIIIIEREWKSVKTRGEMIVVRWENTSRGSRVMYIKHMLLYTYAVVLL